MTRPGIWVLGGYQSDFARNLTREEVGFDGLAAEVVRETSADAAVAAHDIETVHVGNAFGQLFTGQGQLGATGVRMVVDATRQVTGRAGATQVVGARRVGTLNIGGSTATTCPLIVEAPPS